MWTPCPNVLDEPVKVLGLEIEDFGMVAASPLVLGFVFDALASFGLAFLLGVALYLSKRGRPPGAVLHTLHGLELTRLPGILGPQRQRYSAW
jgi:hypothetical protein